MQLVVRKWSKNQVYEPVWAAMRSFSNGRDQSTSDELWLMEHESVFTQGLAGKPEHVLAPADIPVVRTDRGGQVTYHGPGQLMIYPLFDIERLGLNTREWVRSLEQLVVDLLASYGIESHGRPDAPGVYVGDDKKICSVGLRVKKGRSYHGMALNVDADLSPFSRINPCGLTRITMTNITDYYQVSLAEVVKDVTALFAKAFYFSGIELQAPVAL